MTECYFHVTGLSFGGILRDRVLSMVFYDSHDLSVVRNQFSQLLKPSPYHPQLYYTPLGLVWFDKEDLIRFDRHYRD